MATIRDDATTREAQLLTNHRVGRDARSDLVIDDDRVSLTHAEIRWDGGAWSVRDLASTNGTFVNKRRLGAQEDCPLSEGDTLDFGAAASWTVTNAEPPKPTADHPAGMIISEDDDILVLRPGLVLYRGDSGVWKTNDGRANDAFRDGDELVDGDDRFRLSLPQAPARTTPAGGFVGRTVQDVKLHLLVSPGDERITLTASCDGESKSLGAAGHNYLVLLLARARQADAQAGIPATLVGWREVREMADQTYSGDVPRLNTEVYRLRRKLSGLHLTNFAEIIQRQDDELRLGTPHVVIESA